MKYNVFMQGTTTIGIDEAGRGSVAGPILAAAVLVSTNEQQHPVLDLVRDSKKLSAQKREKLYYEITKNFSWAVYMLESDYIDEYGIQQANVRVVELALAKLNFDNQTTIVADYIGAAQRYRQGAEKINFFKKGEDKFSAIAAASIVAKVYRDKLMLEYHKLYPAYNFASHKGYGSKEHYRCIDKHGLSPIHRRSFLKKYS